MNISKTEYTRNNSNLIPLIGTKNRQMLDSYMTGEIIQEDTLSKFFGRNYRGIFQTLRGDKYFRWRFVDMMDENGAIETRQIDSRHLSKNIYQDLLTRAESKKEFKTYLLQEVLAGTKRVRPSYEEYVDVSKNINELYLSNIDEIKLLHRNSHNCLDYF